jgi:F-box-like
MTDLTASTMHRVLGIPELLDMVFRFLDDASNASNARVCRQWSEIALDMLWRDVNDLYRLFGLLAPLRKADDYEDPVHSQRLDDHGEYVRPSVLRR